MSGRLIHAQEAERIRLARELHDDLNQSLALLAVELDMFGQKPPATSSEVSERMRDLSEQVKDLSSSVHRLSHELHPAKLEQLGLAAAVRGLCRELGAAHDIAIEFEAHAVPRKVRDEIALCLYRIVQEGLQNVIKHSGSTTAKVELISSENELCLIVSDQGRGFDSMARLTKDRWDSSACASGCGWWEGKFPLSPARVKGRGSRYRSRGPMGMVICLQHRRNPTLHP